MYTISQLPANLEDVVSHNPNLNRYLTSLARGKAATPRSWLYENINDPNLILQNWLVILSRKLERSESAYERSVYEFELTQLKKWGPQGQVAPMQQLMQDIVLPSFEQSDRTVPKGYSSSEWEVALSTTCRDLYNHGLKGLAPVSYQHALQSAARRGTLFSNSGWPAYKRRNIPTVREQALSDAVNGNWRLYPAITLFRNYNQKTRMVWMFPFATNIIEASFFLVFQNSIRTSDLANNYYAPWRGFNSVRLLIDSTYKAGKFIAASDFSATDAHFQLDSSSQVARVLEVCLQPRFRSSLRESIERMHSIPLVISPDSYIVGLHGVSSGSNWTNFIETVFDQIFASFVQNKMRGKAGVRGLYAIGDDMAWTFDSYNEEFSRDLENLGKLVGQDINADKTHNERDQVVSLQRLFQRGYNSEDGIIRAVYPTIRALKSSVFPERYHNSKLWNSDMFCARQFMILENCVDHPLFNEFVAYVCKGHRDLIPFARQSETALATIQQETKRLPGLNPTYNQEKEGQSLAEFASIRIARTL